MLLLLFVATYILLSNPCKHAQNTKLTITISPIDWKFTNSLFWPHSSAWCYYCCWCGRTVWPFLLLLLKIFHVRSFSSRHSSSCLLLALRSETSSNSLSNFRSHLLCLSLKWIYIYKFVFVAHFNASKRTIISWYFCIIILIVMCVCVCVCNKNNNKNS